MQKTLEVLEAESSEVMTQELAEPRILLNTAVYLLGKSVLTLQAEDLNQKNLSTRVAVLLGMRLANDLRCVSLLAKLGYGLQAASLASSIYEIAYTVAYIGVDNKLAEQWMDHEEVQKTPWPIFKLTEDGLSKLGVPSLGQQPLSEYQVYTQLCMAKHGNPLLQGQHGFQITDEILYPMNGPDTTDASIRLCWFALGRSASISLVASQSLISNQVPAHLRSPLLEELRLIGGKCMELRQKSIKRWGGADPYPGKWKK